MPTTEAKVTKKRVRTDEQRLAYNAYMRRYRKLNREKVKQWQDKTILNRARKLLAAAADAGDGGPGGVD